MSQTNEIVCEVLTIEATGATAIAGRGKTAICRHCQKAKVNRPRGLCWSCYYSPGVREKFPSTSKFARRGVRNFHGRAPMPAHPTAALPGSAEKLAVLEERARRGESLFHPEDARPTRQQQFSDATTREMELTLRAHLETLRAKAE